jgi:hypothetical protein
MKNLRTLLIFSLLGVTSLGVAQQKEEKCRDVIHLRDGSIWQGKIAEYQPDGELVLNTWSGLTMHLPASNVKRIEQKCAGDHRPRLSLLQRPYSFRERGLYHATRLLTLTGESGFGLGLQHSSGLKINRLLGVGIGTGVEVFTPGEDDPSTYPLFLEARGYLSPSNLTPFYAIGGGWAFADKGQNSSDWGEQRWEGGWMAQGQIGYRVGNHFICHVGVRLQRKTYHWEQPWWGGRGRNEILHKRLEVGIGILL